MSADDRLCLRIRVAHPGFDLDLDEEIELSGVTAVFGPSGGGKSTLLRAVAGFEVPTRGHIACGSEIWFDSARKVNVAAHRRPAGFMFQDARLFTHLSVAGNLSFAQRRRRATTGLGQDEVVAALDLGGLLDRRIGALSGGERQRVALARTLLSQPRLLLLDEPLAAIDRDRKADILPYLDKVCAGFGIPTLYVSHDVDEVAHLADRVLVLVAGRVQSRGATAPVLERLELQTLTGRFEAGVLVEGRVASHEARLHLTRVDLQGDMISLPLVAGVEPGQTVRLRIRARDVAIATRRPEGLSIRNVLPGTLLELAEPDAGFVEILIQLRSARIRARVTLAAVEELGLTTGMAVFALIKSVSFEQWG